MILKDPARAEHAGHTFVARFGVDLGVHESYSINADGG
jgi:hypothetical protein